MGKEEEEVVVEEEGMKEEEREDWIITQGLHCIKFVLHSFLPGQFDTEVVQ